MWFPLAAAAAKAPRRLFLVAAKEATVWKLVSQF